MVLIAGQNARLGTIKVESVRGNLVTGVFTPEAVPHALMDLLREYHNLAEEQILSLLDDIERKIESYDLNVINPSDGSMNRIRDLQLNPDNEISFRLC